MFHGKATVWGKVKRLDEWCDSFHERWNLEKGFTIAFELCRRQNGYHNGGPCHRFESVVSLYLRWALFCEVVIKELRTWTCLQPYRCGNTTLCGFGTHWFATTEHVVDVEGRWLKRSRSSSAGFGLLVIDFSYLIQHYRLARSSKIGSHTWPSPRFHQPRAKKSRKERVRSTSGSWNCTKHQRFLTLSTKPLIDLFY